MMDGRVAAGAVPFQVARRAQMQTPSRLRVLSWLVLLLAALAAAVPARAAELEILTLRHRTVDQVLPTLQPLLEPGGALSGMNDKLFVRASAANRAHIRAALAALDRPLRRLRITVRQDNEHAREDAGGALSGRISDRGSDLGVSVYSTRGAASDRLAQQVQVVEGGQARVHIGQSLPLQMRELILGPGGAIVAGRTVLRDLGSGFYARPTLSGDTVTVEIEPQQEAPDAVDAGAVRSHRLSTTVSGRLGEWIALGGTVDDRALAGSGLAHYATRSDSQARRILLRVEELP